MFVKYENITGIPCLEFQLCRKKPLFKNIHFFIPHFKRDSLYINGMEIKEFVKIYNKYFELDIDTENGEYNWYGLDYYSKEKAKTFLKMIIEAKPKDSEIVIKWLEECIQDYNGFYVIGH